MEREGKIRSTTTISLFIKLWLIINDRKFSAKIVFLSHVINQPAVFLRIRVLRLGRSVARSRAEDRGELSDGQSRAGAEWQVDSRAHRIDANLTSPVGRLGTQASPRLPWSRPGGVPREPFLPRFLCPTAHGTGPMAMALAQLHDKSPVDETVVHVLYHEVTNPYAVDGAQHGARS